MSTRTLASFAHSLVASPAALAIRGTGLRRRGVEGADGGAEVGRVGGLELELDEREAPAVAALRARSTMEESPRIRPRSVHTSSTAAQCPRNHASRGSLRPTQIASTTSTMLPMCSAASRCASSPPFSRWSATVRRTEFHTRSGAFLASPDPEAERALANAASCRIWSQAAEPGGYASSRAVR